MAELTAGALNTRITFLVPSVVVNDFNESVETMTTFSEVWAKRADVSAAEALRAQEVGSELTARFTVRWSAKSALVDTRYRVSHNGSEFNISGVRAKGRRAWLEIDAVARAESSEIFVSLVTLGAAAQDVSPVQVSAGVVAITGAAAQDVSPVQVSAGVVAITGAAAQDVSPVQVSAGVVAITGAAAHDVSPVQVSAGVVAITGAAAHDVSPVQVSAGVVAITGAAAHDVSPVQVSAGVVAITGAAAQDVSPAQVAVGVVVDAGTITGAAAQDVSPVQVSAGVVAITGAAAQDVSPVQVSAGVVAITGAAAQDVSPVQVSAGVVAIIGAAAQAVEPVQSAAGSLSSVFSPLDLGTALVEWWDARTSGDMTLGGGNAISAWAGRKAAYSLTQATGSLQPVWNAGGYTVFDASNDYLQFTLSSGVAAGQLWIETTHGWYKSGIGNYSAGTHRVASADLIQLIFIDTAAITAPQLASLTSYMTGTQCALIYKTLDTTIYNRIDNTTDINYSITYYDAAASYSRVSSQGGETVDVVALGGLSAPITVAVLIDVSNDATLTRLYCYNNSSIGSIPSLAANTALLRIYCNNNLLTGSIPSLAANTALIDFECNNNLLTGSIPSLAANTALQYFFCNNNLLPGSIPSLAANTALLALRCYVNLLTGSIPSLAANTALQEIDCHSNQLTDYAGGGVASTLLFFTAASNLLTASAINAILADFVAAGGAGGTLNLGGTGNAAPTGQGILDKATLIGRGWGVTTN